MKVLLLNMPVRFNAWQNLEMPLGIAYIASELEKYGHKVSIKDYEVEHFDKAQFQYELNIFKPDVIGISFRSSSYASAKKISSIIQETNAAIRIVLGGHHATAFPEDTLRDIYADFVVRGEGEFVMPQLLDALASNSDLSNIPGIAYRRNGKIIKNVSTDSIEDLDKLAFPAWHLLPIGKYVTGSILTSRGCPFSCIYCDKGISTRKVRFRSPKNIYQEILAFEKKYKKGRIYFVDDYLFLNKKRLLELFDLLTNDGDLKFKWYCQARVDGIDDEILLRAKKSGCDTIIYGVETGDENELEYINKKTTLEEALRALKISKSLRIKTRANFMIGFPISTHRMISNSIRFAKEIDAGLYRFFIVSPLPNTVLWERVEKLHPELANVTWDKFDFYSPSFDTIEIKKEKLVNYVMAAYLYVLKNKVAKELTIEFIPRLVKLLYLVFKSRRLRGNLSITFPACVNLFLEEWFIIRYFKFKDKLRHIKKMYVVEKSLRK
jgi:radical SAM superfamily enzyme YgiQ (UPF0313 family)